MPDGDIRQYAPPRVSFPVDLDRVVSLDFETYFDQDYSLKKKAYNTSGYILDPQFKVHCVGIRIGRGPTIIYWDDEVEPALRAIDWSTHYLLCHHGHFDGFILSQHYGIVPLFYLCTLSMARALHSNQIRAGLDAVATFYGVGNKLPNALGKMKGHRVIPEEIREEATAYTRADVDLMWAIFCTMIRVYPERELRLIDLTIRMFTDPVFGVDLALAQEELDAEIAHKAKLIEECGVDVEELQSAGKLAQVLRKLGVEPPMKISPRTKDLTFAFSQQDEEFMALGAHEDPRVRAVIAARLAVKSALGETRAKRFLEAGAGDRRLPVYLNYCGAHTTRWSGGNKLNMQNLPRGERDASGMPIPSTRRLRNAVRAPPGHVVVVADSAQIEARVLAWIAKEEDLVLAFKNKADVYSAQASEIYGHPVDRKKKIIIDGVEVAPDADKGFVGKVTVLGSGYGMGWRKFKGTLALGIMGPPMFISDEIAQKSIRSYRRRFAQIPRFWKACDNLLYTMFMKRINGKRDDYTRFADILEYDEETIWMPNGLGLHYPGLKGVYDEQRDTIGDFSYRANKEYRWIWGGTLTENLCQALARIIVGEQMIEISDKWRVATMSHDEIVAVAPKQRADECLEDMLRIMKVAPGWAEGLPLDAEGGYAENYSK
jgi:hypothetical protein